MTPHTLTEVSNFAGQLPEETCLLFRHTIVPATIRCDERRTAAAKLVAGDWYPRLGITDAALADLARGGVLVITDDLPLFLHLSSQRWPVLNFTHVLRTIYGWK
ncbi:MAG: PIN domain-containing protein [Limisphaerales bacterium]